MYVQWLPKLYSCYKQNTNRVIKGEVPYIAIYMYIVVHIELSRSKFQHDDTRRVDIGRVGLVEES